jgi:hypothetical protein
MTIDSSILILVQTFLIGESVFISYFSSKIQEIISSTGNEDAVFLLMLVIFANWAYLKTPIMSFLEWIWFNRNPLSDQVDGDDTNYEEEYQGRRWGAKYMQTTLQKLMVAGTLFLLQIIFVMFVIKVYDYWDMSQYSTFDSIFFTVFFISTLYAFVGIVEELEIK